jgi:chromosome partitioning protein
MGQLRSRYKKTFLEASVPFSTDVEKMGIHRAPVMAYAHSRPAAKAYHSLWQELKTDHL